MAFTSVVLLCLSALVHESVGVHWYTGYTYTNNNNNILNNNLNSLALNGCTQRVKDCMSKGNLVSRLPATVSGTITLSNIQDLSLNFDLDRNGCITGQEYITYTTSRGFSVDYARHRFNAQLLTGQGVNNLVCPGGISVAALNSVPIATVVNPLNINNQNVQTLVTFCDQDRSRYLTNCDCLQLPTACNLQPFLGTPSCTSFKARYANANQCPFSNGSITSAQSRCATNNFGINNQLTPLLRLLCNQLNQKILLG